MIKTILIMLAVLIVIFPIINFNIPTKNLPDEFVVEINKLSSENIDDTQFTQAVYNGLSQKFTSEERCWRNYYSRNYMVNGQTIFQHKGECMPCHIQNSLLQSSLIKSGRFKKEQLKTITAICWEVPMFHTYSQISLKDGSIIEVDQWGSHWNVPFGSTIEETNICNKR